MFYRCVDYERKSTKDFVSYALACAVGETLGFPLNTVKVRVQLQGEHLRDLSGKPRIREYNYRGTVDALRKIISRKPHGRLPSEGLSMIYLRIIVNNSVRILVYNPVSMMYYNLFQKLNYPCGCRDTSVLIPTILTNSALAILAYQPLTVIKVRMQAASSYLPSATPYGQTITKIYHDDGIRGFWRATIPSYLRTATYQVIDVTSYDKLEKTFRESFGLGQISTKLLLHIVIDTVYIVLTNPLDVMRVRLIFATPKYRGFLHFVQWTLKHEGFRAFYKGSTAAYGNMLIWDLSLLLLYERIRSFMNSVS